MVWHDQHGDISPFPSISLCRATCSARIPHTQISLALQLYCSLPGYISLLAIIFIETSCGCTGSLTRQKRLRVSMDLMQGFCVGFQDQVSGLYAVVTDVLLSFCVFVCIP